MSRVGPRIAVALMLGAALAGCGGPPAPPAAGSAVPSGPGASSTSAPSVSAGPAGSWTGDVCALLTASDLATVFPTGPPAAAPKEYGAGFSECRWEAGDARLRVAVVPAADLASDYVDKLQVAGQVAGLGDGAVWFPGVVSIGAAASGGATVGFRVGEHGVLVAVRTARGSAVADDLARATALAKSLPARLG